MAEERLRSFCRPLFSMYGRCTPSVQLMHALLALDSELQSDSFRFSVVGRSGVEFHGDTADLIGRRLLEFGCWEPKATELLECVLKPGDLFIDVGSATGYFSLLAGRAVGETGRVVSIDPHLASGLTHKRAAYANGLKNTSFVHVAVGESSGMAHLFPGPASNPGQSSTRWRPGLGPAREVSRSRLSEVVPTDYLSELRAVKVDVEGDELSIVSQALSLFDSSQRHTQLLLVEVTPQWILDAGGSLEQLMGMVNNAGFETTYFVEDSRLEALALRAAPTLVAAPPPEARQYSLALTRSNPVR